MPGKAIESGNVRVPLQTRLEHFSMPEPNSGCWIWLGAVAPNGYGKMMVGNLIDGNKRFAGAHRVSYEFYVGPIPKGLDLDHKCRMRCCVNPEHLEPVTRKENARRGIGGQVTSMRKKAQTHCKREHPLSGENLQFSKSGKRVCKACRRLYARGLA